jgi:hypothetical protein
VLSSGVGAPQLFSLLSLVPISPSLLHHHLVTSRGTIDGTDYPSTPSLPTYTSSISSAIALSMWSLTTCNPAVCGIVHNFAQFLFPFVDSSHAAITGKFDGIKSG